MQSMQHLIMCCGGGGGSDAYGTTVAINTCRMIVTNPWHTHVCCVDDCHEFVTFLITQWLPHPLTYHIVACSCFIAASAIKSFKQCKYMTRKSLGYPFWHGQSSKIGPWLWSHDSFLYNSRIFSYLPLAFLSRTKLKWSVTNRFR